MIRGEFDKMGAFHCMAAGMNWNPTDIHRLKYLDKFNDYNDKHDSCIALLNSRKKKWNEDVKDFMSPYQYLKKYIHN
jgi:hypothetical protein